MIIKDKETDAIIKNLYHHNHFIKTNDDSFKKYQRTILDCLQIEDLYQIEKLDMNRSYNEVIKGRSHTAVLYVLLSVYNKLSKQSLTHLKVAHGRVGDEPHSWITLSNEFTIDLSLAQFTDVVIPKIAILRIEDTIGLYEETSRYSPGEILNK